jgi:hypothetical protein
MAEAICATTLELPGTINLFVHSRVRQLATALPMHAIPWFCYGYGFSSVRSELDRETVATLI